MVGSGASEMTLGTLLYKITNDLFLVPPYKEVGSQQDSMVETVRPDDGRRRQELNLKPTTISFGDSLAQHSSNDAQQQRDRKPPYSKSSADLAKSIFSCLILIKFIEFVIV